MIALLFAYACHRLGIVIDTVAPSVPVPDDVLAALRARPGSRLRARFDVVESVEVERTVFSVVEAPREVQ